MRLIDADKLRGRVCEIFLCAEPNSAEERRFAIVLGLIDSEQTITLPPNDPLTLEQLREMDGEPVWIAKMDGSGGVWMLVDAEYELCREAHGEMAVFENCGKTWLAYRRRPEDANLD